jgi:hypothetical protein
MGCLEGMGATLPITLPLGSRWSRRAGTSVPDFNRALAGGQEAGDRALEAVG